MHYFCPSCWEEVGKETTLCSHCGTNIEVYDRDTDFTTKLLDATEHFEHETRLRAVWILGKRKEKRAIPKLIGFISSSHDPYLVVASLRSLFEIDGAGHEKVFQDCSKSSVMMVSREAKDLLRLIKKEGLLDF